MMILQPFKHKGLNNNSNININSSSKKSNNNSNNNKNIILLLIITITSSYLLINIWIIKDSQIPDHREIYIKKPSLN